MKNHIPLGQIFGIRIWLSRFVLWMVGGIAFLNALQDPSFFLPTVLGVAVVLGIVLLHELGHSLVAKHFGVKVSHITLWPLGGVAWMEEIPEDPKIEGLIAIAGPGVNFVLAVLAAPLLFVFTGAGSAGQALVYGFVQINVLLGVFNLVPAFPMDGGRILRAVLARNTDWLSATERAVRIGRSVAFMGAFTGVLMGHFIVPFIAVYVWLMGQRELLVMRAKKVGGTFPFGNFAGGTGAPFGAASPEPDFRAAQDPGDAHFERRPGPRRPATPASPTPTGAGEGFSDTDIERLEHFHGRLRRNWQDTD